MTAAVAVAAATTTVVAVAAAGMMITGVEAAGMFTAYPSHFTFFPP